MYADTSANAIASSLARIGNSQLFRIWLQAVLFGDIEIRLFDVQTESFANELPRILPLPVAGAPIYVIGCMVADFRAKIPAQSAGC